jgi:hypothetical protein
LALSRKAENQIQADIRDPRVPVELVGLDGISNAMASSNSSKQVILECLHPYAHPIHACSNVGFDFFWTHGSRVHFESHFHIQLKQKFLLRRMTAIRSAESKEGVPPQ